MQQVPLNLFIFILGVLLTILGTLATWILNKMAADLKLALKKLEENSQEIAIIKVQLSNKVSKEHCIKCINNV